MATVDGRAVPVDALPREVRDGTGRGIVETMRAEGTSVTHLERHVARMSNSAAILGLPVPDADALRRSVGDSLARHGSGASRVRVALLADGRVVVEVTGIPPLRIPARLGTVVADTLPEHKLLDRRVYAENTRAGIDQPLFVSPTDLIRETDRANVFLVLAGRLVTPRPSGILPGVARGVIVDALGASEADLPSAALLDAEEVFLTNALRGVIAVRRIDGVASPPPGAWSRIAADVLGFAAS
ncbi:MAG: aminotransferase class IV [Actinobacteria bacterium]|nr:aminotransferase class IV [Actinomycetota bacterium]